MEIYVVKQGDTVSSIANALEVEADKIIYDNQLIYPYQLAIGQALLIDTGEMNKTMEIRSNGYAYPFISRWVLDNTLPYLSELSIFSYGFTTEGELIPPILDDEWMIERALNTSTLPILTLTPFGSDGNFDNTLINAIVNDIESRDRLIENLITVMQEKSYGGLDIDFEFIKAEDRDAFTEFVRACAERMHEAGFQVSVALAPKTSAMQKGLLYEGKDYRALGEAADHVLVMTYEWGYTYGPPMAVAPLNMVRNVLEYAITEIPPGKISMGIPNYGYDWELPYERGITRAKTIGNIEAVRIAISRGAEIKFDEVAMTPYFNYDSDGITHEVWFEDARSIQAKYDLMKELGLRGPGFWQIMQLFRTNWLLLEDNFYVIKE